MNFLDSKAKPYQMILSFSYINTVPMKGYVTLIPLLTKMIQISELKKAEEHDGVSIRMLKLGSPSLWKPPSLIFHIWLSSSTLQKMINK